MRAYKHDGYGSQWYVRASLMESCIGDPALLGFLLLAPDSGLE